MRVCSGVQWRRDDERRGQLVGCSRMSGLLLRSVWTAGPDGVREQVPMGFAGYHAYDFPWVVLVPGPTGRAILLAMATGATRAGFLASNATERGSRVLGFLALRCRQSANAPALPIISPSARSPFGVPGGFVSRRCDLALFSQGPSACDKGWTWRQIRPAHYPASIIVLPA